MNKGIIAEATLMSLKIHPHISPILFPAIESKININRSITTISALKNIFKIKNYDESLSFTIQYVINY